MDVVVYKAGIPAMSEHALDTVSRLTAELRKMEQEPYTLDDLLHAEMYARTVTLPPGLWTGAKVQRGTILTIVGDALVYIGEDKPLSVSGVTVLAASAGRKQAFYTETGITIVMVAAFAGGTAAEAEAYLCAEPHLLPPRGEPGKRTITQTGE
jgi:hypothetical protein